MKLFCLLLRISSALALVVFALACSSPLAQRAQRADGLLGFLFDSPGPDIVPVERISRAGGYITTAHATADGAQLRVSGLVRKAGLGEPPLGSHIDVLALDANGKVTAGVATEYFPRPIPRQHSRGGMGYSHYAVRLPSIPVPGSMVRVVFHGVSQAECELRAGT